MRASIPPLNIAQLNVRVEQVANELSIPIARARLMLCALVVSQMLPEAVVVKGGMGVKLRLGESGTRATSDLDVFSRVRGQELERAFRESLAKGWGSVPASKGALRRDPLASDRVAFTATLKALRTHNPGLSHPEYVMHPYHVSISFLGVPWSSLDVEVSDPEIDSEAYVRLNIAESLIQFASRFSFGELQPVELAELEYQIAQKIHAVTDPAYSRAHDLVDLQVLWNENPDLLRLREVSLRTFAWRNQQQWPPLPLRDMSGWEPAYDEARKETNASGNSIVLPNLEKARHWLAATIEAIDKARN